MSGGGKEAQRLDASCGLYCGACNVYLATVRGTTEALAEAWGRPAEELVCRGCRSAERAVFCADCAIRRCAMERGVAGCGECPALPCERLTGFRAQAAHHAGVMRAFRRMKSVGRTAWLAEQHARWNCPGCGWAASWYDTQCSRCGTPLVSCRDEEAAGGSDGGLI